MKMLRPILVSAAALLLLAGYFLTARVPAGQVGVVESGRPGETPAVLGPGFHLRRPGARFVLYPTTPVTGSGQTLVTPATGGEIPARFVVTARLDPGGAARLAAAIAGRPLPDFLSTQAGILLREYASRSDAVEILTPQFRARAAEEVAEVIRKGGFAEAAMTIQPPDEETLLAASQFLAPRSEAGRIRETVAEALAAPGGEASWKLHTAMGLVNESERKLAECEKNYLDALAIEPVALPPMTQLVALYSSVGEWTKLLRVVDAALTASPRSLPHINWAAMALLRRNETDAAERMIRRGLEIDPNNSVLLMNLGGLFLKTNRLGDAIEPLRNSVESDPTNNAALYNLGSALAALDRFDEALPYLERAEQNGTLTLPLARALQVVHEKLGHAPQAASYRDHARRLEAEAASRRPRSDAQGESHDTSPTGKRPS